MKRIALLLTAALVAVAPTAQASMTVPGANPNVANTWTATQTLAPAAGTPVVIKAPGTVGGTALSAQDGSANPMITLNWHQDDSFNAGYIELPTLQSGRGPTRFGQSSAKFNAIDEPVASWGYNQTPGGVAIVAGEVGDIWNIEPHYYDTTKTVTEIYNQYLWTDGTTTKRPIFWQIDNATNRITGATIMGAPLGINLTVDDGTIQGNTVALVASAQIAVLGQTGTDTNLYVQAATSRTGVLNLGYSTNNTRFQIYPGSNFAQFNLGSQTVLRLYDTPNGGAGSGMAVGCADNGAVATFCSTQNSLPSLVARESNTSSSTADIFQTQQADATVRGLAITAKGHAEFKGTAPAVTTGAADCGTSPSIVGNDNLGRVTVGSSTNGGKCTLTFATAWANAPICVVQDETTAVLVRPASASTTTVALTGVIVAGDTLVYQCGGYR